MQFLHIYHTQDGRVHWVNDKYGNTVNIKNISLK
jgi:hypothetical protein